MILSVAVKIIGTTAWILIVNTMMHAATKTGRSVFYWSLLGNVAFYLPFALIGCPALFVEPLLENKEGVSLVLLFLAGCVAISSSVLVGYHLVNVVRGWAEQPFDEDVYL